MNAKGYTSIPRELCYWITFLTRILPLRSQATFVELLIGAMLTQTGFVTDAYLMLNMQRAWGTYYKWLEKGNWSWLLLARQFTRLLLQVINDDVYYLAIDDTVTLRASKKAPCCRIHHQHGNKPNLAQYVLGQCWVSLALVTRRENGNALAIPLLNRLVPSVSNTGKLIAANTLVRAVFGLFKGKKVRVLVDSWFMRRVFIEAMNAHNFSVIGQVRIDTRLYDIPDKPKKKQRGRPRKYGEKYTPKRIAHLKRTTTTLLIYGKEQRVRYRSKVLKARFLNGQLVRVVWSEYYDEKKECWKPARLLLSTEITQTPEEVIESYGLRWSIEGMFNQLKLAWGLKEAWQQTRRTLNRWVHLTMIGYGLMQLLTLVNSEEVDQLCRHSPWRKEGTKTAGHIRKGLVSIFRHVDVRRWWNKKRQIFEPPNCGNNSIIEKYSAKAA